MAALATLWAAPALASEPTRPPATGAMSRFEAASERRPAPAFAYLDAADRQESLAGLRGKVVLVNFWATWCVPCVKEMPGLDRLAGRIGPERFTVLALSLDGPSRPKVAPFIESKGLKRLEVRFDARRAAFTALGVSVLPTSVLFDAEGREVGRLVGDAEWDSPEAEALVRHVLDARS
ncbi:MAG: TlpA family protein disulfide reductase [Rhodospirillales bacterium]|nr:MAG: TlpA family protein disulfide reductase [Rhodospirillales bacterium]